MEEVALQQPWCRNGYSPHGTSHSTDPTPTTEVADDSPPAKTASLAKHLTRPYSLTLPRAAFSEARRVLLARRLTTAV